MKSRYLQDNKMYHVSKRCIKTTTPRLVCGFALVFAVMVSGILLAIGMGMFSIVYKELMLSSTIRDSQIAFYAADSAAECALYWDTKHPNHSSSVFDGSVTTGQGGVYCNEEDMSDPESGWRDTGWVITYPTGDSSESINVEFDMKFSNGACAVVNVLLDDLLVSTTTTIRSRGYNTCVLTRRYRTERGLRISY